MILPRAAPRWPVWLIATVTFAVGAIAFAEAALFYGKPIAGVLVDPNAVISSIGPSDWPAHRLGLGFPDEIVEADGIPLWREPAGRRARVFDEVVASRARAGAASVRVAVKTKDALGTFTLRIHPLDGAAWWLLAGVLFFAGALYITAGLIALWASPRGALARSWGVLTTSAGLFLFTLFDFHTTRTLVPVFFLSFALLPIGLVVLPLRLPDDAAVLRRWPWLELALYAFGLLIGGAFITTWAAGGSTRELQVHWSRIFGCGFLFFVAIFLVRFMRARGERRAILRALLWAMVPPMALLGFSYARIVRGSWAWTSDLITYPALSLPPLATAYAFVRHNLWGGRALLSRVLANLFVTGVIAALAVGLGTALATQLGAPFPAALAGSAAAGLLGAALVALALGAVERRLFPALAEYKPTIEQLSEQLINITSPEQVARAIERNVERWLPCEAVELELEDAEPSSTRDPRASTRRLRHESSADGQLTLPVTFGEQRLGTLRVGRKRGGALFSHDDLDLLYTIVNQGALALAHAHVYRELEARRRQQAAAWRGEREALVETVAAEIAHEVRYPLNFFRTSFERLARGEALDAEDVDIGREEIDRLERMVSGLRRMAAHRMQRQPVRLIELCGRAEVLLRDALGDRRLAVDVDPGTEVRCDPDQATQILVNLVSNALEAAGGDGNVGIELQLDSSGAELRVWDTGPGFVGDASRLFAPWYTTKDRGTGLGLAITHRLVRAHGWNVAAARRGPRTLFCVRIPSGDLRQHPGGTEGKAQVA